MKGDKINALIEFFRRHKSITISYAELGKHIGLSKNNTIKYCKKLKKRHIIVIKHNMYSEKINLENTFEYITGEVQND